MAQSWKMNEDDRSMAEELKGFIPQKVFDAHAHIYRTGDIKNFDGSIFFDGPDDVGIQVWKENIKDILGKLPSGGLLMPVPQVGEEGLAFANNFLEEQLRNEPGCRGLMLVSNRTKPEEACGDWISGFKPYHMFSKHIPTFDSKIDDFVPEWVFAEADKRQLCITLHMVRDKALSDPENQRQIREKCLRYPGMKLILAHAARGFNSANTIKGIGSLEGLQNVWFDTSGICEPDAIKAILYEFGPEKVMWGSDFPVSHIRGKCVTAGDSFIWLGDDTVKSDNLKTSYRPVMVGYESVKALKTAADDLGLNDQDVEDIFYNNAAKLLGIIRPEEDKAQKLYRHAKMIIPGGVQLLSKRPEMFAPDLWPPYFSRAKGCQVWDIDGRHYYDMSINGIGACLLGYRDEDVTRAVKRRINYGSMSTLNPPEEVYLAEKLIGIHPWAEQARFARTGGEIGAIAVRFARAATDKSLVAVSGYHGWHDWYLAANLGENDALRGHLLPGLEPLGVPGELRNTTVTFKHGSFEEFDDMMEKNGEKLAAVIMEPCRHVDPPEGFLAHVREETRKRGILLIFDEITIGWRLTFGGAHLKLGIDPDMAIFAKALGNGHPIAAVIGTREAMRGVQSTFVSSTYWTESTGPAAALAVLDKLEKNDVASYVKGIGTKVLEYWKRYGEKHGLPLEFDGVYPCLAHFRFDHNLSKELATLYTQLMLEKGFLAGVSIYPTFAHDERVLELYGDAIDEVFGIIGGIIADGKIEQNLKGPVAHTGFRRLI